MQRDSRLLTLRRLERACLAALPLALMGINACETDGDNDGWSIEMGDCDDFDPDSYPGAPELCDGLDNDCDGDVDDGVLKIEFYRDVDGDGYGTPDETTFECTQPPGYADNAGDCDDTNAEINPGHFDELGDGTDANCDALTDIMVIAAGTGYYGYTGDGGNALEGQLALPRGVEVTADDRLFIADSNNHAIRQVDAFGTLTTIAGTGVKGFSGDGGPATEAQLSMPRAAVLEPSGALFIADTENNRIRRVAVDGIITTVAGTGTAGFSGDGGPATAAQLNQPKALFLDGGGNLFLSDAENDRVRKIDTSGIITTVAGDGTGGFGGDGGPATAAQLNNPRGLFVDASGLLYIVDTGNSRVRLVDSRGDISTVAGGGTQTGEGVPAVDAILNAPRGVTMDLEGNLFIGDYGYHRIRMVHGDGTITTVAGTGVAGATGIDGPATTAQLYYPYGITMSEDGVLYIADFKNSRVTTVLP